jgi:hypothetical protein
MTGGATKEGNKGQNISTMFDGLIISEDGKPEEEVHCFDPFSAYQKKLDTQFNLK